MAHFSSTLTQLITNSSCEKGYFEPENDEMYTHYYLQTALLMKCYKPMMKFHPHHDEISLLCHLQENPVLEIAFDKVFANPAESNLSSLPLEYYL